MDTHIIDGDDDIQEENVEVEENFELQLGIIKSTIILSVANTAALVTVAAIGGGFSLGLVVALGVNATLAYKFHELGCEDMVVDAVTDYPDRFFYLSDNQSNKEYKNMIMKMVVGGTYFYNQFTL